MIKKVMQIIVNYDGEKFTQREVVDSILEVGGGQLSIPYYTPIGQFPGKNSFAFYRIESFCQWILRECTNRGDSPAYIDEYISGMLEEWWFSSHLTPIAEEKREVKEK